MDLSYEEWRPAGETGGAVTAFWAVAGDGAAIPSPAILPDGHVEIVFNLGDPVSLEGPAFTGGQPARAVVGLLSRAVRMAYRGRVRTFGIRLHPAWAAAVLSAHAADLTDRIRPLADVSPSLDRDLAKAAAARPEVESEPGRSAIEAVLRDRVAYAAPPDPGVVGLVDDLCGREDSPNVGEMARRLGVTPRHLLRRFEATVGVPPKRFLRLIRFARAWQAATMRPVEAWAGLAAEAGFSDQAHMVREFRAFGAESPTHQFTKDWYPRTRVRRVSGPRRGVRSVQDPRG